MLVTRRDQVKPALEWNALCAKAKQLFAEYDVQQKDYFVYLIHSNIHTRPELAELKTELEQTGWWDSFSLRSDSYQKGLISEIFEPFIICED